MRGRWLRVIVVAVLVCIAITSVYTAVNVEERAVDDRFSFIHRQSQQGKQARKGERGLSDEWKRMPETEALEGESIPEGE